MLLKPNTHFQKRVGKSDVDFIRILLKIMNFLNYFQPALHFLTYTMSLQPWNYFKFNSH